ncbi:hypothetical protein LINGRAHAP2_LOCUS27857 [Linum grandiflorum]
MVDLESEVFLASFDDPIDYLHALSGGPWTILGHYLVVIWIRFPRLPYQYYHHDVLVGLGNLVGKSVRPDIRTQNSVRGKYARIAVEVNLAKPLPKEIFVDGVWQIVEYENLPSFCIGCGCFGQGLSGCPNKMNSMSPAAVVSETSGPAVATSPAAEISLEPVGEWQVVGRKNRRLKKETHLSPNGIQQSNKMGFGRLWNMKTCLLFA